MNLAQWQDIDILDRMVKAVEDVKDRLRRAAALLEDAGIPYAVVGGNAVATWVGRVDKAAVRNTQDVDILIRRDDLEAAKTAFAQGGFVFRHVEGIDMFLDGPDSKARDAVHILFATEKVRSTDLAPLPDVDQSEATDAFRVISLQPLVIMKLTSYRDKDRTHLRDLIDVELLDQSWLERLPPELAARLKMILDTPEG